VRSEPEVGGGVLSLTFREGDHLLTGAPFSTEGERLDAIEIRIRLERGTSFEIGWSRRRVKVWRRDDPKVRLMKVGVVPDGEFHVYRVNAEQVMKLLPGQSVRSVILVPSDLDGDRVTLDYVRLLRKRDRYASAPAGRAYEMIDGEMRPVVHARVPLELAWDVVVPDAGARLELGMAVLDPGGVRFAVDLLVEGVEVPLLRRDVSDPERWEDARLDLSEHAGRSAVLRLRVDGEPGAIAFWSSPTLSGTPAKPIHVVVLLEDALRADHLSAWGYPRPTSPEHDAVAREGVVFEHTFSNATKTRASVPSFMTSLHPTATGVWNSQHHLVDRYLTLAEVFRSQGFVTASFIQNLNAGPESGLHQGFDFLYRPHGEKRPADVFPDVARWIERYRDRSFFLYVHVLDPHGAYDPPEGFGTWYDEVVGRGEAVERDPRMDPEWVEGPTAEDRIARYDGEIRSNDHWLGELRRELDRIGIADDVLLAVIADHGEHLGAHGLWEHTPPGFRPVLHVPWLIHRKGLPAGLRIDDPVALVDLAPTLLELAGIDPAPLPFQGRSWAARIEGGGRAPSLVVSEEVISYQRDRPERIRASLFFGGWHLLWTRHDGRDGLRAFRYREDPDELRPLASAAFDPLLERKIHSLLRSLKSENTALWAELTRDTGVDDVRLDPETQDQLRALGYID